METYKVKVFRTITESIVFELDAENHVKAVKYAEDYAKIHDLNLNNGIKVLKKQVQENRKIKIEKSNTLVKKVKND